MSPADYALMHKLYTTKSEQLLSAIADSSVVDEIKEGKKKKKNNQFNFFEFFFFFRIG